MTCVYTGRLHSWHTVLTEYTHTMMKESFAQQDFAIIRWKSYSLTVNRDKPHNLLHAHSSFIHTAILNINNWIIVKATWGESEGVTSHSSPPFSFSASSLPSFSLFFLTIRFLLYHTICQEESTKMKLLLPPIWYQNLRWPFQDNVSL